MTASPSVTVKEAIAKGAEFLKAQGIESARLEIELIVAHSVGLDRLGLYMNLDRKLTEAEREISRELLKRRRQREPLAYILGQREFYGVPFEVTRDVLIPRPETELLVDQLLGDMKVRYPAPERILEPEAEESEAPVAETPNDACAEASEEPLQGGILIDIGTGSGAIAIACAAMMRRRKHPGRWIATDVSEAALAVARRNAERSGLETQIEFRAGSFFEPMTELKLGNRSSDAAEAIIAICANPPYIAETERENLQPEVGLWEPGGALFSGPEGLDHLRRIISDAPDYLAPGGVLLLEIGFDQGDAVRELIKATGAFEKIAIHADLAGHPRVAQAYRL